MKNFNNSNNSGSSRGPKRFGSSDSRGSNGSNRPRFGSQNSGGFTQMHEATCADCGGDCKVPFLPTSGKPVYCSNCFEKRGNGNDDSRRPSFNDRPNYSEKRNFSDKKSFAPRNDRGQDTYNKPTENFSKQFDLLNAKLDAVLAMLAEKEVAQSAKKTKSEKTVPAEKVKKIAKVTEEKVA